MALADKLLSKRHRTQKWAALDGLETTLMTLCGLLLFGFCTTVTCDIVTREIGRPWLWLQEATSTLAIYAIFCGTAVATRRSDHLYLTALSESLHGWMRTTVEVFIRLVILGVGLCMLYFGFVNFIRGFSSFRMPSMTPIASLYAAIPLCGALVALFAVEQIVNGTKHGFDHPEPEPDETDALPGSAALSPNMVP